MEDESISPHGRRNTTGQLPQDMTLRLGRQRVHQRLQHLALVGVHAELPSGETEPATCIVILFQRLSFVTLTAADEPALQRLRIDVLDNVFLEELAVVFQVITHLGLTYIPGHDLATFTATQQQETATLQLILRVIRRPD